MRDNPESAKYVTTTTVCTKDSCIVGGELRGVLQPGRSSKVYGTMLITLYVIINLFYLFTRIQAINIINGHEHRHSVSMKGKISVNVEYFTMVSGRIRRSIFWKVISGLDAYNDSSTRDGTKERSMPRCQVESVDIFSQVIPTQKRYAFLYFFILFYYWF